VETNLVLNWGKCHSMVKEGIVLGHKISKKKNRGGSSQSGIDSKTTPLLHQCKLEVS